MWTLRPEAWQGPRPPEWMPNTTCDKLYLLVHVFVTHQGLHGQPPQMSPVLKVVKISGEVGSFSRKREAEERKTLNHNEYLCSALLLSHA